MVKLATGITNRKATLHPVSDCDTVPYVYSSTCSYSLVRKVLANQEVPGKNIGTNKCTGTSVCRKPEVQILVPVHELSPDFC